MRIGRAIKVFGVFLCTACLTGQTPGIAPPAPVNVAPATSVTGIFNWIHSTADLDRGYAFYHGVFGIEMVNAPFGAIPGAPPPNTIRARAQAISDPIVGNLTDTGNARFRNLFMRLPGAEFGLELSEFNDIEARTVRPNLWDPGATTLILEVRDIDSAFAAIRKSGALFVTLSAAPVKIGRGVRSVFIRDPDGYLIQVIQASPEAIAKTPVGSTVVGAAIGLTVADMAKERAFYQNILGFDISGGSRRGGDKEMLALIGLKKGRMYRSDANIPGTRARVEFYEFQKVRGVPLRLRIQDPGAPQLQLAVRDLDPLMQQAKEAGVTFVSVGAKPIQRAFGRFIFVLDPNGVLVEFVHPAER